MKKILYILLFFPLIAVGQDQNYTKKTTYKQAVTTSPTNPDLETAVVEITYFDGLGNPIQKNVHGQSNEGKDIITHIEYDVFGRQVKEYLPYPSTQSNMEYVAGSIAQGKTDAYYMDRYFDSNPYSEKLLETSPLSRVFKQSAPGNSWAMGSGHEIKLDYQTNADSEVKYFKATATWNATLELYNIGIIDSGHYNPNELYKTITKDENWTSGDNNTTQEFKNKEGQVVLKRTFNGTAHDTYYVYDQFGNLTYVIPPLAEGIITEPTLSGLCYQYKYDSRNRMVAKKLPGKQWEFIIYNKLDMPTATGPVLSPFGDGAYGWLVTKYEPFGRVAYTGWYDKIPANENGRKTFQTNQNNSPGIFEMRMEYNSIIDYVTIKYSTKSVFPLGDFKLLTVNYYDDYNYPNAPTDFSGTEQPITTTPVKGLPTGSWVRVLTSPEETFAETSYTLYDAKYRPIRTHTTNHLGGYTRVDSKLDFAGKTEYAYTRHRRLDSSSEMVVNDMFTYNAQDRMVLHKQQINGMAEQLIARNTYDKLGQLISKNVGGNDSSGSLGLQKVDYKYNIRGWLKTINDINDLNQSPDPQDLFAFYISYQDNDILGRDAHIVPQLFNGNITETFWRTAADNILRKYDYNYDNLSRLTNATYQKPQSSTPQPNSYNETVSYDKNGNIQGLTRKGEFDDDNYTLTIDQLTYSYHPDIPNQLMKVFDSTNIPKGFDDDSDGFNDLADDYMYDANGNMTKDDNKLIGNIQYNHLNLPTGISINSQKIGYIYNALGQKVQKVAPENIDNVLVDKTTDYLAGGFQYKDGLLLFFPHAEGYVNITDGKTEDPHYVFNYTDHLSNVRVSYGVDPSNGEVKILEESNYYPFGLKHANYNVNQNTYYNDGLDNLVIGLCETCPKEYKYKYNGKELQDELGLNWYDYQARNYDPALGRWMNMDPLAEVGRRWSPYNYVYNNPLRFVDPDGMVPEDYKESEAATAFDSTFGVDDKGNIKKIDDTKYYDKSGKEVDKLIAGDKANYNSNGELTNYNVDVSVGVLENKQELTGVDKKGNDVNGYSLNFGTNANEAKNVYDFLSNAANVEFSYLNISNPTNAAESKNMILTSKIEDKDYFGPLEATKFAKSGTLNEYNHTHPIHDSPNASPADYKLKSDVNTIIQNLEKKSPNKTFNHPTFKIHYANKSNSY